MIKCDKEGARCHIWYHGRYVKITARRAKAMDKFVCYNCANYIFLICLEGGVVNLTVPQYAFY